MVAFSEYKSDPAFGSVVSSILNFASYFRYKWITPNLPRIRALERSRTWVTSFPEPRLDINSLKLRSLCVV